MRQGSLRIRSTVWRGMERAVGVLEHHLQPARALGARRWPSGRAVDQDPPGPVVDQAGDGAQHRALARAALADQAEGAALGDVEADPVDRAHGALPSPKVT